MFADDRQIAEAIVGCDNAEKWMRERLPALADKQGFPAVDDLPWRTPCCFGGPLLRKLSRHRSIEGRREVRSLGGRPRQAP
ncbi:hypothetical protein [Mesorhizobium sp. B4-1-1]|uniref:hypothetical protein n=1 Tax=Mesorhizobium sp. B4-1-1 TaxID=2589890 RepID=UPI00112CD07B|nr:hypothetical protein [Mesorhizobium sp. B4-1-1]TPI17609.1 hypothetical protein FJW10_21485 [Mesorhizobium sp. B4-1-1]